MNTLKNFFRVDCTNFKDWLLGLQKGLLSEEDREQLASLLDEVDPIAETKGSWSERVCDAEVIYVGDNNVNLPTNPMYKKVVGFKLCEETRVYLHIERK